MESFFEFANQNSVDIALFGDEFEEEVRSRIKIFPVPVHWLEAKYMKTTSVGWV